MLARRRRRAALGTAGVAVVGAAVALVVSLLPAVAVWLKPDRRFAAGGVLYNDHGTALGYAEPMVGGNPALPSTARDMTGYQVDVANGQVEVGAARPGAVRHFDPHRPASGPNAYNMDQVVTFDPPGRPLLPVVSISQALARPAGTVSLVDADIIMGDGGAARVCSAGHRTDHVPFPPCPAGPTTSRSPPARPARPSCASSPTRPGTGTCRQWWDLSSCATGLPVSAKRPSSAAPSPARPTPSTERCPRPARRDAGP
jgi:hypothetical protein